MRTRERTHYVYRTFLLNNTWYDRRQTLTILLEHAHYALAQTVLKVDSGMDNAVAVLQLVCQMPDDWPVDG
jgi:hypothetical protein